MLLSFAAAVAVAPFIWLAGSLAGVAATTLVREVRIERQVRAVLR